MVSVSRLDLRYQQAIGRSGLDLKINVKTILNIRSRECLLTRPATTSKKSCHGNSGQDYQVFRASGLRP